VSLKDHPGQAYSFSVMIVLNMALFVFVAVGQTAIYAAIHSNTLAVAGDSRKQQNASIARRLIAIAVTDFLCFFPVSLFGILAKLGFEIPKGVNTALVTFVIPLNPAFNPVVYTLNHIVETRRRNKEQKLLVWLKRNRTQPDEK
jgi:hypothetical protein